MHRRRIEQASATAAAAAALGLITALLGVATAVLGLVPALRPWGADAPSPAVASTGRHSSPLADEVEKARTPASVFLNRDSGPGGTKVEVSGEGFTGGESVVLYFHTDQIGRTTTNADGKFSNVSVVVPRSYAWAAPEQFEIRATGRTSVKSASAPFTLSG